jgi:hypothetical protein
MNYTITVRAETERNPIKEKEFMEAVIKIIANAIQQEKKTNN